VFDKWGVLEKQAPRQKQTKLRKSLAPVGRYSTWQHTDEWQGKSPVDAAHLEFFRSHSLPNPNRRPSPASQPPPPTPPPPPLPSSSLSSCCSAYDDRCFETYLEAWSENLLAEFDTIIGHEATTVTDSSSADGEAGVERDGDDDYDEVAGDSPDDDGDDDPENGCELGSTADAEFEMKYRMGGEMERERHPLDVARSSSSTISAAQSGRWSGSCEPARRTPPYLARKAGGKRRSHVATVDDKCDPVLVNVKPHSTRSDEPAVGLPHLPQDDRECAPHPRVNNSAPRLVFSLILSRHLPSLAQPIYEFGLPTASSNSPVPVGGYIW